MRPDLGCDVKLERRAPAQDQETMYHLVIAQCIKTLKQIETYLDRAEKFAAAKDFDVAVLVNDRLAPDMNNFIYQVQSACDYVKAGAGWLSGQRPPKHRTTNRASRTFARGFRRQSLSQKV
jgi:hypothetical protein